jgi:DNA-binding beta-propeller fold protein YncE
MTLTKTKPRFCLLFLAALAAAPAASGQSVPVSTASLVQTVHTSLWSPPSPDPSCVTFRPETGDFWTTDNEVDEMAIFAGVTLWRHDALGNVSETFNLTGFTGEPSGIAFDPAGGRAWIADDNQKTIWKIDFGSDGQFLTADDVMSDIDGLIGAGCLDPEDVTYNPFTGNLHVTSIDNSHALCTIATGPNGDFDDVAPMGDDVVTIVPLEPLGLFPKAILKPKGITYDPLQNTLIVADRENRDLFEFSVDGVLLRKIDTTVAGYYRPSGVTVAASTVNPMLRALYVTDNAVDNGLDETENDGKIHQFVVAPLNGNAPPVVDAGPAQSITWPADTVSLAGFVSDDGHPYPPSALVSTWVPQSGPGTVSFGDPNALDTTATFSMPGSYVLRLEGDDFALTASDTVAVSVNQANPPACGIGPELALFMPGLWALRRRTRRRPSP